MIPTLIVAGLVFGRWWRTTTAVGVVAWPVGLLAADVAGVADVPLAAGLALVNTGAGVLVHQMLLRGARRLRGGRRDAGTG